MTMFTFRADDADAAAVDLWAGRLHIDRSELLRVALRRYLVELSTERDVRAYTEQPVSDDEQALAAIADWGPTEDWADWADAADAPR